MIEAVCQEGQLSTLRFLSRTPCISEEGETLSDCVRIYYWFGKHFSGFSFLCGFLVAFGKIISHLVCSISCLFGMEELSEKEAACPKLLDLIPRDREWVLNREGGQQRSHGCTDEEKLELRLGLPGDDDSCWPTKNNPKIEREESFLSLRYLSSMTHSNGNNSFPTPWPCSGYQLHQQNQQHSPKVSFLQYHTSSPAVAKESSQPCSTGMAELQKAEKAFSSAAPPNNTAVPGNSQKRAAPAPVVGWPPIRSFRKNLASNSKSSPEPLARPQAKSQMKSQLRIAAKAFL
ncbi:hypothetical protein Nepgr_019484 [Nepenthes gracilis]|uniref:Auxin-responsive protein n=1 Tax=Nepenthes gracilis TaxID=150966 RepID=A0AAD3STJ7_NEPGR|nr:hypothetical protein Nepgr_019484 [Nepenthes gracilis]